VILIKDTVILIKDTVILIKDTVILIMDTLILIMDTVILIKDTVILIKDTVILIKDSVILAGRQSKTWHACLLPFHVLTNITWKEAGRITAGITTEKLCVTLTKAGR
jgi:sulfur transfer complex TusBCD TusB component (DsrH family)